MDDLDRELNAFIGTMTPESTEDRIRALVAQMSDEDRLTWLRNRLAKAEDAIHEARKALHRADDAMAHWRGRDRLDILAWASYRKYRSNL